MDMISSLPNEIICHIVSFLSAKEAAFTTVLSKRFQNLFKIIPNLQFDDRLMDIDEIQWSFMDFEYGVLDLPASSRVRNFSIRFVKLNHPARNAHINRCLCAVLKHGILNLELHIAVDIEYSLPFELFTCKTVVELKLRGYYVSGFVVDVLPENAFLPALETLVLTLISFRDRRGCAFEKLLSACPVLKELIIYGSEWEPWKWPGNLSILTLQRLIIRHEDVNRCNFMRINLDTPSLTYLEFSDVVPDEFHIVNLDSLVEANLDLTLTEYYDDEDFESHPTNLIQGLRNVEIMNLQSTSTFQVPYDVPVLWHLLLTITSGDDHRFCWEFLPHLLKKSPNLQTLVIDGPLHYDEDRPQSVCNCLSGYSFLLSCRLKVLKITDYHGTTGEVEQLNIF